ncbi:MAG TPA: HPP family protein [Gammaproteobacteria bacterium]|nr:HPP family protein [Gammaproteobacteria bacterium]
MNTQTSSIVRGLLLRQQPAQPLVVALKAGVGGLLAVGAVAWLSHVTGNLLLMAPFGATCVLLFSVPNSPLSQPANVIGGHLVSTFIGLLLRMFLPVEWWSPGLAVGLAIAAMAVLRVTHPPAGADPLVVFFDNPGWEYLGFPVAFGSMALVGIAWVFHRLPMRVVYPTHGDN